MRRRWPEVLIGWSRLLDGRWRDPLVGRALLAGSLVGIVRMLLVLLTQLVLQRRGPEALTAAWPGIGAAAAELLGSLPRSLLVSLLIVVLLVVLRIVLRSKRAAAIAFVVILSGVLFPQMSVGPVGGVSFLVLSLALLVVHMTAFVVVATRLGLVALVASHFVGGIGVTLSVAFPHPRFLTETVILGLVAMLAPGIFGFYTSMARGKATAKWLD